MGVAAQLHALGAAVARVHEVPLEPRPHLPLRVRPTSVGGRTLERRWATVYRAAADDRRPEVVEAYRERTGATADGALGVLEGDVATGLLQLADDLVREHGRPRGPTVFVHGDMWWATRAGTATP